MMNTIKRCDVVKTLKNNGNQFFGLVYVKADGTYREATGRLSVVNPKHTLVPGTGKYPGMTGKEAIDKYDNLKYFDCTVDGNPRKGQTRGKGDYRIAKISSIKSIKIKGISYEVID